MGQKSNEAQVNFSASNDISQQELAEFADFLDSYENETRLQNAQTQ